LLNRPTQLDSQQKAPPYKDGKQDGHLCFHQDRKAILHLCEKNHSAKDNVGQKTAENMSNFI
jgi:hypothetical protein